MASAACPNCHILLVEASSAENTNLYASEDEAVTLGATEVSNSYEGKEVSSETSSDKHFDHPGVPIFASAGDAGYGVRYPAASQYVIAVGGTALTQASNSRGWSETVWKGTGSGCSAYEPKPAWQTASPSCTKRTNNDIAAVASTETPVSVADSYELPKEFSKPEPGWTLVAGTSVSSPLMAGTMALANAHTRSFAGADAYYLEASQNGTGVLTDVTSGSNGSCGNYLCNGEVGYDGPTGLGSPYRAPIVLEPPTVVTKPASPIAQTTATLNATVNPNSGEVSKCEFEYGTTNSYGSTASCVSLPGNGNSPVAVSAAITGLTANTTYHCRIVATNPGGTNKGSDETFKTLPSLTITTSSLPGGYLGAPYSQTLTASGGITPYIWTLMSGSLPAGLSLNAETGAITGTPTAPGNSSFTVKVTDSSTPTQQTATANLSINVAEPTYATAISHYENPELGFSEPNAVAVDPSGDIFIADQGHNRIVELNSARKYLRQFGEAGSGEGQFNGIGGIATNSTGDVYVSDFGNSRIQEFGPAGEHIRTFGQGSFLTPDPLEYPSAIAIDSSGNVWVLNAFGSPEGGRIAEFSSTGTLITKFGQTGSTEGKLGISSFGLAISGGHLYVAEYGTSRVQELSTTGEYLGSFDLAGSGTGKSNGPWGIAADPVSGNLYVSEVANNRVQEFSPAGAFITTFGSAGSGSGQFSGPGGVAVGPTGQIFIADTGNNRIEQWAP